MISKIIIHGYRIFQDLTLEPDARLNILVGDNETGKSTILEAIALALSGRIDGRWAGEELSPYWFNAKIVKEYFEQYASDSNTEVPSISIELFFDSSEPEVHKMRGVHNSAAEDAPGVVLRIALSPDYIDEFKIYMAAEKRPNILPTEYFDVAWRDFNDMPLRRRPKALGLAVIDSRTIRSKSGVDHHTREILSSFLDAGERAAISIAHRQARHEMTTDALSTLNEKLAVESDKIHDAPIGVAMDQSARASWESDVVPHVTDIPFAMAGQGQQASIKVALAMRHVAESAQFVLIEEPETHLSYSRLQRLIDRIESLAGATQQLFITTHSSFVLNRLGLDKLLCLLDGRTMRISDLDDDTVSYFKHLSGYDTLRLVLANRLVLVEGPSDEMVFKRGFKDATDSYPENVGIDVVSMNGIAFKRALELCACLDRDVVVLQDNDNKDVADIKADVDEFLSEKRVIFVGESTLGYTLEPQLRTANGDEHMKKVLRLRTQDDPVTWMPNHKTEGALRILESQEQVAMPDYIQQAIEHLS